MNAYAYIVKNQLLLHYRYILLMYILIYDVMFSNRQHTCTRLRIFQMDLKQYLFFYYFNNIASMDAFLLSICIHVQYWEGILNKALIKVLLQFCLVFCNVYIAAFCSGNWSITYIENTVLV